MPPPSARPPETDAGFTIIEVVVASTLLLVAFVAAAGLFVSGTRVSGDTPATCIVWRPTEAGSTSEASDRRSPSGSGWIAWLGARNHSAMPPGSIIPSAVVLVLVLAGAGLALA